MSRNSRASQVTPPDEVTGPASGPPPSGRGGHSLLIRSLAAGLVIALGAGAAVLLLGAPDRGPGQGSSPDRPEQKAGPAPTAAGGPGETGTPELAVPTAGTGTTTLSDPEITVVKAPLDGPAQWCSLLTAEDVRAATGFDQQSTPDAALLCTHYLAGGAGYLFVSDIPAPQGASYLVRGNSAIVFQRDPTACEVSVALNRGGGVLDIDVRGIVSPRVALCDVAAHLAVRAFDRLPDA